MAATSYDQPVSNMDKPRQQPWAGRDSPRGSADETAGRGVAAAGSHPASFIGNPAPLGLLAFGMTTCEPQPARPAQSSAGPPNSCESAPAVAAVALRGHTRTGFLMFTTTSWAEKETGTAIIAYAMANGVRTDGRWRARCEGLRCC